jgi:hypothetical protein
MKHAAVETRSLFDVGFRPIAVVGTFAVFSSTYRQPSGSPMCDECWGTSPRSLVKPMRCCAKRCGVKDSHGARRN